MLIDSAREKYFTGKYVKRWWRKKQKSLVTRNRPTWPDSPSFLTSEKAIHLMYHCWDKEMVSSQTWAGSALLPVSLGSHPASGWVPCQYWQGGGLALLAQQDLTYKDGLARVSPKSAGMLPRWQLCFYLGHSCRYAGMRTRLGAWVWDGKGVAGKGMGFSCSWPDVRVAKLSSEVQPAAGPQSLLLEVLAMPWNPLLSVRHPNNLRLVPCIEGDTYLLKALSETSKLKKRLGWSKKKWRLSPCSTCNCACESLLVTKANLFSDAGELCLSFLLLLWLHSEPSPAEQAEGVSRAHLSVHGYCCMSSPQTLVIDKAQRMKWLKKSPTKHSGITQFKKLIHYKLQNISWMYSFQTPHFPESFIQPLCSAFLLPILSPTWALNRANLSFSTCHILFSYLQSFPKIIGHFCKCK